MGNVRVRPETGNLLLDFRYRGVRCREQTTLPDTPANRRRVTVLLAKVEAEITLGTFDYARYFPDSANVVRFSEKRPPAGCAPAAGVDTPTLRSFAATWYAEMRPQWRSSHAETVQHTLNKYIVPRFGERIVTGITKAEILEFRAFLSTQTGHGGRSLSPSRINHVLTPFRMLLAEAADRYEFVTPFRNIKPLRVPKSDVEPFNLDEVQMILANVREDYRSYYTVRFFTGMRTGEIDGLQWRYVDFDRRIIRVREAVVRLKLGPVKNDGSLRDIQMSQPVFDALMAQFEITGAGQFVFCSRDGTPLYHHNVSNRVWYPLLRYLGLQKRRPYQTRHTAATMWLAAGESPEWIARQMGHASTEMLFRVYSRYVPNLTRQDGSAFDRLISHMNIPKAGGSK